MIKKQIFKQNKPLFSKISYKPNKQITRISQPDYYTILKCPLTCGTNKSEVQRVEEEHNIFLPNVIR